MAFDPNSHRIFSVARKRPDTRTGNEVTRMRVAGECDDVFFEASRKRIYVISAEGFVSVV